MAYTIKDFVPRDSEPQVDVPYRLAWRKVTMAEKKMVETHAHKAFEKMSRAEQKAACVWVYEARKHNPKPDFYSIESWTEGEIDDYFADDPLVEKEVNDRLAAQDADNPGKA